MSDKILKTSVKPIAGEFADGKKWLVRAICVSSFFNGEFENWYTFFTKKEAQDFITKQQDN